MDVLEYLLMFYLLFGFILSVNSITHEISYDPDIAGDYELWLVGMMLTVGWPVAIWMALNEDTEEAEEEVVYEPINKK